MAFFSAMNVTIRSMAGEMDPLQMVFFRNLFSFLILLPFALRHGGMDAFKTNRLGLHFMRAAVGLVAMQGWFIALANMPVNTATAISFSAPLFATILAILFLGERIGWMRAIALLVGFTGVLIIINPSAEDAWNSYGGLVLFATAIMAVAGILVKKLTVTEPSWRIVLYMSLFMSLLSFPPALAVWQPPTMDALLTLSFIALLSTIAQMALTQALYHEQIVTLMPFEFLRLIFTAILAWLAFAEPITLRTVIGSAVIVASAAFIAWRESVKKRSITTKEVLG